MVLPSRIELPTSPLPRGCSTTELRQRTICEGAGAPARGRPRALESGAEDATSPLAVQANVRYLLRPDFAGLSHDRWISRMTTREPSKAPENLKENPQDKPRSDAAQDRLAQALRENLKRRKAQERARRAAADPPDEDR